MKMIKSNTYNKIIYIMVFIIALIFLHEPFFILFSNINNLMKKDNKDILINNTYKNKVDVLTKELSNYEEAYNNIKLFDRNSYVLSKVSIRDIYKFYDYMYITCEDKVKKGNAVINEDGLVGIVSEEGKSTYKVNLLTSIKNMSVKISSSYGLTSEYNKKNNTILIKNINNYQNINIGDEVITSGLSDLPYGLKIGTVKNIETKGIEKLVYVSPYVDFNNLNYLYVVTQ